MRSLISRLSAMRYSGASVDLVRESTDVTHAIVHRCPKVRTNPYVLFLIRPDGLDAYYQAVGAPRLRPRFRLRVYRRRLAD